MLAKSEQQLFALEDCNIFCKKANNRVHPTRIGLVTIGRSLPISVNPCRECSQIHIIGYRTLVAASILRITIFGVLKLVKLSAA